MSVSYYYNFFSRIRNLTSESAREEDLKKLHQYYDPPFLYILKKLQEMAFFRIKELRISGFAPSLFDNIEEKYNALFDVSLILTIRGHDPTLKKFKTWNYVQKQ